MKKFLIFCMSMLLLGCGNNTKEEWKRLKGNNSTGMTREEYLNSLDSTDLQNSLVYFASDTAFTTNANLLLLLDTLYQHVKKDEFPSDVKKEEKWMADYRSRLAAYYDSSYGKDTLSIIIKADSVLNDGVGLLELDCDRSTMGMIVDNVAQLTLNRCKEYGLLSQLIESCKTNDTKELVYKEWALYEQMLNKIRHIAANMSNLNYWSGSIVGPLRTASYLHISQSRRDMYQTLLNENEADKCDREYDSEDMHKEFDLTVKETKLVTQELRPIVDEWIVLLDQLDEALTHDNNRHSVERIASNMLIKWASIITKK